MIWPEPVIRTGLVQPNSTMLAAIWATCGCARRRPDWPPAALYACRHARNDDQFPASVCAFRGWAGRWRPCARDLGVLGRCGLWLAVSVRRFRPVFRFQWGNSRFPQISFTVTSQASRCALPALATPSGRTRGGPSCLLHVDEAGVGCVEAKVDCPCWPMPLLLDQQLGAAGGLGHALVPSI
jgi:hypothetical protein